MKSRYWTIVFFTTIIVGCSSTRPQLHPSAGPPSPQPVLGEATVEEYNIFETILRHEFVEGKWTALTGDGNRIGGIGPVVNQIVLADRTIDTRLLPGDPSETDDDFEICSSRWLDYTSLIKECDALRPDLRRGNRLPARIRKERFHVPELQIIAVPLPHYNEMPPIPYDTYDKYPRSQGYTILSRPGFSKDHSRATVVTGTMRAGLYGHGMIYLLKKTANGWKVVDKKMTWIS